MTLYNVVIADDSERARKAIRMILSEDPHFRVISEATSGYEAIEKTRENLPDLVLMDINMPGMNGLEATRIIKQHLPNVLVVILSVSDDAADLFEAIRNGAQGYLVKSLQPEDWVNYLLDVLNVDTPISRTTAQKLLAEFKSMPASRLHPAKRSIPKLTSREQEIAKLVSTGATNREIASKLFISENTVKNHLKNMMAKLHIQHRVQLVTYVNEKRID